MRVLKGKNRMKAISDQFIFTVDPIVTGDSDAADALRDTIVAFWQDYLRMDTSKYLNRFTPDAIRLSGRAGARQAGRAAIQAGMPAEWEAFERPNNRIAEQMTIERAEFHIAGNFATAICWLAVEGGSLWEYSDQGLVFQAFVKQGGHWLVAHHTDTWSLDYDVSEQQPGPGATIDFDFAYPVNDLARAVEFYTPLLGTPEFSTSTRAVFNLKGGRFILDTSTWGGRARVRKNLPNGYAVFSVKDAETVSERIAEVTESGALQKVGADTYCVGMDVDENLFVIWEKDFNADTNTVPTMSGFPSGTPVADAAHQVMRAWLAMDSETLKEMYAPNGTWFDDTRLKHRGQERGAGIAQALQKAYWPRYDHGENGMTARLEVRNVHTLDFGSQSIVSYDMRLIGQGPHPFRDSAWVTQVFNRKNQVEHTFIVDNNRSTSPVLELDYTGYPVQDMDAARRFYAKTMRFGEGYDDEGYYGFWSNHAVFGLYEADPEEDDLPQSRQANGYMSFWVRSAKETYAYLKENGRSFPMIPAINDKQGIDAQPGYTQVVTTDSEGNLIIFTEYSGQPR
jgi:catechol 2,3-dioxygenase-like lactoylglutathione lyase family enzyme/ketosteroid isomerase-like protein/predicted enzyme related to lactoylglutathione lyase